MATEIPGTHFEGEVAQKVFIVKDGRVLMVRYPATAPAPGMYDFPGGRLHKGESPLEGLTREAKEELGIDVIPGDAFHFHVATNTYSGIPRLIIVFWAELKDPNAVLVAAEDEIAEIKWISRDDVQSLPTWDRWKELLNEYFSKH